MLLRAPAAGMRLMLLEWREDYWNPLLIPMLPMRTRIWMRPMRRLGDEENAPAFPIVPQPTALEVVETWRRRSYYLRRDSSGVAAAVVVVVAMVVVVVGLLCLEWCHCRCCCCGCHCCGCHCCCCC